jgi:hypothetical protein
VLLATALRPKWSVSLGADPALVRGDPRIYARMVANLNALLAIGQQPVGAALTLTVSHGRMNTRPNLRLAHLLLVPVLNSCHFALDPKLPADAEQFVPPRVYSTWWKLTEECSGLSRPLGRISWFRTARGLQDPRTGRSIPAYWSSGTNRIVVAGYSLFDAGAVRHEMLHSLIGKPGHPRQQFLENCAGNVYCADECQAEAGPPPTPTQAAIPVTAEAVEVAVKLDPVQPNLTIDDGFFRVVVEARNATEHAVMVTLDSRKKTFAFVLRGPSGSVFDYVEAVDSFSNTFAPFEVKRQLFDFRIGNDRLSRAMPPGTYKVSGSFAAHSDSLPPVPIGP